MKAKTLIILLFVAAMVASCASPRAGYKPSKRKKDDCNCSRWSYNPTESLTKTALFV
jgi:hypothetical protein